MLLCPQLRVWNCCVKNSIGRPSADRIWQMMGSHRLVRSYYDVAVLVWISCPQETGQQQVGLQTMFSISENIFQSQYGSRTSEPQWNQVPQLRRTVFTGTGAVSVRLVNCKSSTVCDDREPCVCIQPMEAVIVALRLSRSLDLVIINSTPLTIRLPTFTSSRFYKVHPRNCRRLNWHTISGFDRSYTTGKLAKQHQTASSCSSSSSH